MKKKQEQTKIRGRGDSNQCPPLAPLFLVGLQCKIALPQCWHLCRWSRFPLYVSKVCSKALWPSLYLAQALSPSLYPNPSCFHTCLPPEVPGLQSVGDAVMQAPQLGLRSPSLRARLLAAGQSSP